MVLLVNVFIDGLPVQKPMEPIEIEIFDQKTNQTHPSDSAPFEKLILATFFLRNTFDFSVPCGKRQRVFNAEQMQNRMSDAH